VLASRTLEAWSRTHTNVVTVALLALESSAQSRILQVTLVLVRSPQWY